MVEVLYCPRTDKIFLFNGKFKLDEDRNVLIIYVYSGSGRNKNVIPRELTHVGWL